MDARDVVAPGVDAAVHDVHGDSDQSAEVHVEEDQSDDRDQIRDAGTRVES